MTDIITIREIQRLMEMSRDASPEPHLHECKIAGLLGLIEAGDEDAGGETQGGAQ